jgi:hypothetical protein
MIRFAATSYTFREVEPGIVEHTALSALLATNSVIASTLKHQTHDLLPVTAKLNEAVDRYAKDGKMSGEPDETAFALAHGLRKGESLFAWYSRAENEARKKAFHEFVSGFGKSSLFAMDKVAEVPFWKSLPRDARVVDVGGSTGHVSVSLASRFESFRFVVQDLPEVVSGASSLLSEEMRERIEFQAHDFMSVQPVQGANVYLLRWVLHDWSDKYAAKILSNIAAAMGPQSQVVVIESITPPPGAVTKHEEKSLRAMDLQMMMVLNSKERDLEGWRKVVAMVENEDGRVLEIKCVEKAKESALSVIVIGWKDLKAT